MSLNRTSNCRRTEPEFEHVLLIAIDQNYVSQHSEPFEFMCYALDRYFSERIGSEDVVVICGLSGNGRPLLWQGTPQNLRRKFPTQEDFRSFMMSKTTDGASINDGLARSLNYVARMPQIKGGCPTVALVLSTMLDDGNNTAQTEQQLFESLREYATHGAIGFYFCDQLKMDDIQRKTEEAGFQWSTIQGEFNGHPPLPRFE